MRGSPLFRTFILLLALITAALGIRGLSHVPTSLGVADAEPSAHGSEATVEAPFFLTFSSPPETVRIDAGSQAVELAPRAVTASGTLQLSGKSPVVFLTIKWPDEDSSIPRFAKLTLEPAGQPTLSRTFDGFGHIDDLWEISPSH